MDLKTDDILNVDDSELLLCYDLHKLNLDSITNDILDFTDEISQSDSTDAQNDAEGIKTEEAVNSDSSESGTTKSPFVKGIKTEEAVNSDSSESGTTKSPFVKGIKTEEAVNSDSSESGTTKSPVAEDEPKKIISKVETKTPSKNIKRKIDINGNEEILSCEDLDKLFVKLELSDSENKEVDDKELSDLKNVAADDKEFSDSENEEADEKDSKLTERGGPIRPSKRASRNRRQKDICNRIENYDIAQFDSQRLRHWSGSSQVQVAQSTILNVPVGHGLTPIFCANGLAHTSTFQDFFDDARAQSVSSPESGYDSSAHSITGSPPPLSLCSSISLDFIPETVDEENVLDFISENTDCALGKNSHFASGIDSNDVQYRINEIINDMLKDAPIELNKSSSAVVESLVDNNLPDNVPLFNNVGESNIGSVTVMPVLCSPVSRNVETPKKLVYKLQDKAKQELRKFLSKEEFYAIKEAIYKRISEDKLNNKKVKVIYVENETDKTSENRTNLHHAVLNSNVEQIYCLVEIHKQYGLSLSDINIRDKYGKTALDYAIQNEMTLVVNYLKENTACRSVNI